jgi:hypothetical protein
MSPSRRCLSILLSATVVGAPAGAAQRTADPTRRAGPSPAQAERLARRLCDALHALPAQRRQACCGGVATSLAAVCTSEMAAAIRRGALSIDASNIDRCASESEKQLTGCSWVTPLLPSPPAACTGLVTGKLGAGAACQSSLECENGLYCRGVSAGRSGVCRPPAPPHAVCEFPADNIASYARAVDDPRHASCEGRCEKGQCLPFASAGSACVSSALCQPGLHCVGGKCAATPLPGVGDSCAATNVCDAGAYCDGGRCAALKDAGAACALPFECRALACDKAPDAKLGKCADACVAAASPSPARR